MEQASNERKTCIDLLHRSLSESREQLAQQWRNPQGTNTRHFVLENPLPEALCRRIYEAFPRDGNGFFSRDSFREKKRTSANLEDYDRLLGDITYAFQDRSIVALVSDIVGFINIEPDPKLYAGGLSMMFKGDFLNPHIDNSHDSSRKSYRRLNLLYYVSPNWALENGGNFELWDSNRTAPKTLIGGNNRLVVMETNKTSWHSVSPVLVEQPRCCVSNYYFSDISPDDTRYFHVTSFTGRPEERLKRMLATFDNGLRNVVFRLLGISRGRKFMRKVDKQPPG
jgi:Rps23 Pro-64 3,4-dihydroxylase Tpa1-like proline 4-hydroxylase